MPAQMAEMALADFRFNYPEHQVVADVRERNWTAGNSVLRIPEDTGFQQLTRQTAGDFPGLGFRGVIWYR